jgi:hypothetical protein
VLTAKAGLSSSGCETCLASTSSCSCTYVWAGADAFTTACTNGEPAVSLRPPHVYLSTRFD